MSEAPRRPGHRAAGMDGPGRETDPAGGRSKPKGPVAGGNQRSTDTARRRAGKQAGGGVMDQAEVDRYRRRARILKALAHPTRLFIVEQLARGERCVCELTSMIGADVSTVSRHLSLLREAGILADRKEGREVFYRLQAPCVTRFFSCVEQVIRDRARLQAEGVGRS